MEERTGKKNTNNGLKEKDINKKRKRRKRNLVDKELRKRERRKNKKLQALSK